VSLMSGDNPLESAPPLTEAPMDPSDLPAVSIPPPPAAQKRLSSQPLPAYRFVPGRHPHPTRNPEGHGVERAAELDEREAWLYGIDLFNTRYFWEAHEAWEKVWHAAPNGSRGREVVKGLIQIAAALLKLHLGNEAAARGLAARGVVRIEAAAAQHGVWRGLHLEPVARLARQRIVDAPPPLSLEHAVFELDLER
jgi:uncharacterized protein